MKAQEAPIYPYVIYEMSEEEFYREEIKITNNIYKVRGRPVANGKDKSAKDRLF